MAKQILPATIFVRRMVEWDGSSYLLAYKSANDIPEDEKDEKFTQYSRGKVVVFSVNKSMA